jgi:hypothetical protein
LEFKIQDMRNNDYKSKTMHQPTKRQKIDINGKQNIYHLILKNYNQYSYYYYSKFHLLFLLDEDDEIYNNPNLHSEEQDELEIPDGKIS